MAPRQAREVFETVRALLQQRRDHQTWERIKEALREPAARSAQFREEYRPAIVRELDARWPDELRAVSIDDTLDIKSYGSTLVLSLEAGHMQRYGAARGKTYRRAVTKKMIREMAPHWAEGGPYTGLRVIVLRHRLSFFIETLLKTDSFDELAWVSFEMLCIPHIEDTQEPQFEPINEMVHTLIDARGSTLRALSVTWLASWRGCAHAFYQPLIDRADELPALRELMFGIPQRGEPDILLDILANPAFDALDTLVFRAGLTPERAQALIDRPASRALRRVAIEAADLYPDMPSPEVLVTKENVANVEAWAIEYTIRHHGEWDSEQVARLRDVKMGRSRDTLAYPTVDLANASDHHVHDALFDEQGALRPSETLRALRIPDLSDEDFEAVIARGHEAWPLLECLVFCARLPDFSRVRMLKRAPLLGQLDYVNWLGADQGAERRCRVSNYGDSEQAIAQCIEGVDSVLDGDTYPHPVMAYHVWLGIRSALTHRSSATKVAKHLGIQSYSKLGIEDVRGLCEGVIVAALGGPQVVRQGRDRGEVNRDAPFEWPAES